MKMDVYPLMKGLIECIRSQMTARQTYKPPVRRKIAIISRCNFFLNGMSYIAHKSDYSTYSFKTNDFLELFSSLNSNIEFDDVLIHMRINVSDELRLIHKLTTSLSPARVFVVVNNVHLPTFKLLRAIGVIFIFSLRDSLSYVGKLLQNSSTTGYISPDFHTEIKIIQAPPAWAKKWDELDDVQYLTPTETEIIMDLLQGISPPQVAKNRFVSVKTVSTHKINTLRKMQLRGISEFFITSRS